MSRSPAYYFDRAEHYESLYIEALNRATAAESRLREAEEALEIAQDLPVDVSTQAGADALNRFDAAMLRLSNSKSSSLEKP